MRKLGWLIWPLLWTGFFTVGLLIRLNAPCELDYELYGYDYGTYTTSLASCGFITYMPFRHPLLGLLLSPFIYFAAQIARVSPDAYLIFLHMLFATFGVLAAWLVKEIAGWMAVTLFLTIPFVWLAAAIPESYAISMCVLLATMWWVENQENHGRSPLFRNIVWGSLFVVAGGVTLTNGLKVVAAYLLSNRLSRRQMMYFAIGAVVFLLLGVAFFGLRMYIWNAVHPDMHRSVAGSIKATLFWVNSDFSCLGRIKAIVANFFLFPITMGNGVAVLWAVVLYVFAAAGAWFSRRQTFLRVMAGMFAVDAMIHIVCGWALEEAWIFSPHWIWMLPVLGGRLFDKNGWFARRLKEPANVLVE